MARMWKSGELVGSRFSPSTTWVLPGDRTQIVRFGGKFLSHSTVLHFGGRRGSSLGFSV